ncbi:MAG TPA: hypothetical protein VKU00_19480 [Chthonomonadaceae bacterium]|nr:hypothetical protein [Chthonomonadaceae bacterium]
MHQPIPDRFWGIADQSNRLFVFTHLSVGDRLFVDAILNDQVISPNFMEGQGSGCDRRCNRIRPNSDLDLNIHQQSPHIVAI